MIIQICEIDNGLAHDIHINTKKILCLPHPPRLFYVYIFIPRLCNKNEKNKYEQINTNQYRSLIGTLNYAYTACRFDVVHAMSVLSRHIHRPTDRLIKTA